MFPTHVGMNRHDLQVTDKEVYVPHTRGDEPDMTEQREMYKKCSPHTWG